MGPRIAYCLCSRVGPVAVAVLAPTILYFVPLSIVAHTPTKLPYKSLTLQRRWLRYFGKSGPLHVHSAM